MAEICNELFCTFATKLKTMAQFNEMQAIKRNFFAMRNGIVADSLRKAGSPFTIIFGVNLPQLDEIAVNTGKNKALALQLYNDTRTRESMLVAPMVFPPEEMTPELALEWLQKSKAVEVTDILCHKLLRKLPFAPQVAAAALQSTDSMLRYGGIRLLWNLLPSPAKEFKDDIKAEVMKNNPLTRRHAEMLLEEIDFLTDEE